jgi:hypothetical protein
MLKHLSNLQQLFNLRNQFEQRNFIQVLKTFWNSTLLNPNMVVHNWKYWKGKIVLQLILTIVSNFWKISKLNYKSHFKIFGLKIF